MTKLSLSEFADRLNQIIPVIMKEFGKRTVKELYQDEVTLSQFFILQLLFKEGESKMSDLAKSVDVSTPAMTGIADRLVKAGYIQRTYDPADRRIIRVKLTSKGEGLVKKINQDRREMVIKIFGKISAKDREDYLRVLTLIHDVLASEKGNA